MNAATAAQHLSRLPEDQPVPVPDEAQPTDLPLAAIPCPSRRGTAFCGLHAGHSGGHYATSGEVHVRWPA